FKFFCILLPSLLKTNVCFYHIYLFKLREAKVEETEIIDNIESWRRLLFWRMLPRSFASLWMTL
ncbi:MAG: hypothetical protein IJA03_07975, partial [Bacteroidaceae bacterium]|nr:hypothetical protein [Bacteroidaceae bacterium]